MRNLSNRNSRVSRIRHLDNPYFSRSVRDILVKNE
jgi:hypothetical protein